MHAGKLVRGGSHLAKPFVLGISACVQFLGNATFANEIESVNDAAANSSEAAGLEEIVVTAQRRMESLQNVPIAISALTGAKATALGVNDVLDLPSAVPSLMVTTSGNSATMFLRGVGSNAGNPNNEPSVATYVDGIYYPNPNATIFAFDNIDRIEVSKGPQGTLFGRNATGGVIQIITRDPTQAPVLEASVSYGNYDATKSSVYAAGGLATGVALGVAAIYSNQGTGFGHDLYTSEEVGKYDSKGLRAKLLLNPGTTTEIRIGADYEQNFDTRPLQVVQDVAGVDGKVVNVGDFNTRANWPNYDGVKQTGGSIRIDQDFGIVHLASISGYRYLTGVFSEDGDATPTPLVNALLDQAAHSFTQELQLLSSAGSRVTWLLGWFRYNGFASYDPFFISGEAAAPFPFTKVLGDQRTRSDSAYGQATAEIIAKTNLTLGVRYTDEATSRYTISSTSGPLGSATSDNASFDKVTWRASLDHHFNSDVMAYISDNRGIKSGGFDLVSPGAPYFKPEVLNAYEIGVKSELFDRQLRLNVAGFYYWYEDIQVETYTPGGFFTTNAASASVTGMDLDFETRLPLGLTLAGGTSYLDGRYDDYPNAVVYPASVLQGGQDTINARGKDMIEAPHFTGNAALRKSFSSGLGDFTLNAGVVYHSTAFVSADNRLTFPAYALVNGSMDWTEHGGRYGVRLWAKNLTGRTYYDARFETGVGDLQIQAAPREYGIEGHVIL